MATRILLEDIHGRLSLSQKQGERRTDFRMCVAKARNRCWIFQEWETINVCAVVLDPSILVLLARHREVSRGEPTSSSWCITRETRMTRTASSRVPLIIFQDTTLVAPAKSQIEGIGKSQCAKTLLSESSAKLLDDSIHKVGADVPRRRSTLLLWLDFW